MEESKETILELIQGYNSSLPAEGKVHHICFKVDSLEDEIERLKKHAVTFLLGEEIETLPDGTRYIFFAGPDGEWIEFLRRRDNRLFSLLSYFFLNGVAPHRYQAKLIQHQS